MIELRDDVLVFSFPEVHPAATLTIGFQRTLRIPDDDKTYPLPPGLGQFPLRHVDDFAMRVSPSWIEHGGVMLPMYQSEAMWLNFDAGSDEERGEYPFAVKIATGKINAVSGQAWANGLHRRPQQDYVVVPEQPWLDGYCVGKGIIRQFVAMPMGAGYTAEEQITGKAEHGGLQVLAFPMKRSEFERRFRKQDVRRGYSGMICESAAGPDMGLAPGGRMRQEICKDPYRVSDWDTNHGSRCFVHIANSMVWRQVTGENPPTTPPTSTEYTNAGLPWFLWYDDKNAALDGSDKLAGMKSVAAMGKVKKDKPLPENASVSPEHVVALRRGLGKDQVREFAAGGAPKRLELYIGGGNSISFWIELKPSGLHYRCGYDSRGLKEDCIVVTDDQWKAFRAALDEIGVWGWMQHYATPHVCDGTQWSALIEYEEIQVESGGSNCYPQGKGGRGSHSRTKTFDVFLTAVHALIGGRAFH